jgi:transposase
MIEASTGCLPFSGPREFAAFLGLTPRQNSSGGKERLGRVSKMGNRYLRKLLVVGAHAVLYHRKPHEDALRSFAKKLMQTCQRRSKTRPSGGAKPGQFGAGVERGCAVSAPVEMARVS